MITEWCAIYERRLNWAYEARHEFIDSLSKDLGLPIKNQNEKGVTIAVYGNPQVGKTSLILKLIGIRDDVYEEIYDLLRYDRRKGQSVTVTSMIYKKSEDNSFYIKSYGKVEEKVSKEKLKEKLIKLREDIEENKFTSEYCNNEANIQISVPLKYFKETDYDMVIVDLPGIDSKNEKEHPHVKSVISNIIPIASLVLFVCERITDFEPKNIQLQEIKRWHRDPERFRLILTRSVSAKSVMEKFKKQKMKASDFFDYYEGEFERTLKESFEKGKVKFYPLEYGESYTKLKENKENRGIYNASKIIIDQLLDNLCKDIKDNSTEHKLLLRISKYWNTIEQDIKEQIEKIDKKTSYILKDIHTNKDDKSLVKTYIENKKINASKIDVQIIIFNNLLSEHNTDKRNESVIISTQPAVVEDDKKNVKYFKNAINNFCEAVHYDIDIKIKEIKNKHNIEIKYHSSEIKNILDGGLEKISNELENKVWEHIYLADTRAKYRRLLKDSCNKSVSHVNNYLRTLFTNKIQEKLENLHQERKKLIGEITLSEDKIQNLDKNNEENSKCITKLTEQKQKLIIVADDGRQKYKDYFKYLESSFKKQFSKIIENVVKKTGEDQFYALLEGYLIASEMEKLEKEHRYVQ